MALCNADTILQQACDSKFLQLANANPQLALAVLNQLLCNLSASGGGGGSGSAQIVTYTSGTPANPPDTTKPALAYDPNGILPGLGWNVNTLAWV